MKRAVLFSTAVLGTYYLMFSYIFWTFNIIEIDIASRFLFILIFLCILAFTIMIIASDTEFFFPTHEEKMSSVKKYTWELKEELELYAEASGLEQKVKELEKLNNI